MSRVLLCLLALLALAGCGESSTQGDAGPRGKPSSRLVDLSAQPPLINSFDIDAQTDEFLLTTNKGFFRIDPKTDKVTEVKGTIRVGQKASTVGTFLFVLATGNGQELIGSGHPDTPALPEYLGFIKSADGGKSWEVLSRLGEADLHKIITLDDKLIAFDAVLGAMLVSTDGGKTFTEKFTPRGLIIDFVVSPAQENVIFAATEEQLFRSEDAGESWRSTLLGEGIRLAWTDKGAFFRAVKDGTFSVSTDEGSTWKDLSKLPGEPYKIKAIDAKRVYVVLSDGTIMESTDGGVKFEEAFRP